MARKLSNKDRLIRIVLIQILSIWLSVGEVLGLVEVADDPVSRYVGVGACAGTAPEKWGQGKFARIMAHGSFV